MTTSNTVFPVEVWSSEETDIVVIPMNGNFSVGILNNDQTEAFFPLDYDEQDSETASRAARAFSTGFYGSLTDYRRDHQGYTMPYPIQRR